MSMDNELRNALRREEPPEGFAERVLAKVPARRPGRSRFSYVAVAATLILALLFGDMEWRREQQLKERNARETLLVQLAQLVLVIVVIGRS